ncbi:tRNA-uridine aminocarboxypropyltransferase [Thalassotalea sp. PLHSN55]|uniref:tRNA-uridine aminocarboxypropyltransferase n=1 Tax=Thalassotalea sp. PLHSN55 TaxID=3435888 RepID=UPI003F86FDE5
MTRTVCYRCQRPERACICQFFTSINNAVNVVILQHPTEVSQSKGTVPLLFHSLSQCQIIEGEDFTENPQLNALLNDKSKQVLLLYPSEQAIELTQLCNSTNVSINNDELTIILLDATWKKAYRMYMLSQNLHQLAHITLPVGIKGLYDIRSTTKKHALSTLEACIHALTILERDSDKYQNILNNFVKFNQFQLRFRP